MVSCDTQKRTKQQFQSADSVVKGLQTVVAGFKDILKQRGYNWEFNQLHTFFRYDQGWTIDEVRGYWETFMRSGVNRGGALDFYIHIPFCRSKCSFCPFHSWLYKDEKQVDAYVDYVIEEMEFFRETFKGTRFKRLLVGGGTPNILNKEQFTKLFSRLFEDFSFTSDDLRIIECNPDFTTAAQMKLFKQFGFNKINFGVQSLSPQCLEANRRGYQTLESVKSAIQTATKAGFTHISADLIVGLAGDALDRFAQTFAEVARCKPENIIVHGLKPPDKAYLSGFLRMSPKEYFMDYYPRMIHGAFAIMRSLSSRYGYNADKLDAARWQWGFRHKDCTGNSSKPDRVYTGEYTGCGSLFGLGIFARSHIFGSAEYRYIRQPRVFSRSEKVCEGKVLEKKEEMIKFILNHLDRNSNIPRKPFKQLFGITVADAFPYTLYSLKLLGAVRRINSDCIDFSFPKPEEKYIYSLFFFREAGLA